MTRSRPLALLCPVLAMSWRLAPSWRSALSRGSALSSIASRSSVSGRQQSLTRHKRGVHFDSTNHRPAYGICHANARASPLKISGGERTVDDDKIPPAPIAFPWTAGRSRISAATFSKRPAAQNAGWGGRDRTSEWRNQNPLPYRLATPHQARRIGLARKRHAIPGRRPWSTDRARPFQPPRRRNFAAPPGDPTFPPIRQCWQALIPHARSRRGGPPRACAKKLRPGRFHGMTAAKSANSTFEDTP